MIPHSQQISSNVFAKRFYGVIEVIVKDYYLGYDENNEEAYLQDFDISFAREITPKASTYSAH